MNLLSRHKRHAVIVSTIVAIFGFTIFKGNLVSEANPAPQAAAPLLTATKTASTLTDVNANGYINPGDSLRYLVTINNGGVDPLTDTATGVAISDTIDANTTLVGNSVIASAVAVNDAYSSIGNVGISVPDGPGDLIANDLNPNGAGTLTIIAPLPTLSTNGGNVSINPTTGAFSYNPPPGFEGTDTFSYTLSNGTTLTDTAVVSINVSGMIWFVNNNAAACTTIAAGCGRITNPFSTLAAFQAVNNGTGNNPAANDNIFVSESASGYPGGVILLPGQKLIGQDATASLQSIAGIAVIPPFSSPALPAMDSANVTVTNFTGTTTLNTNTTLRGFSVNSTTSTGINDPLSAITGVTASEVAVTTTSGIAVLLSGAGGTFSFRSISSNGAPSGLSLTSTTGSFTVTGTGGTCTPAIPNCTGGTIQTSSTHGINLNNVTNVVLNSIRITGSLDSGINGAAVNGFVVNNSTITSNGNDDATDDSGIEISGLTGTVSGGSNPTSITNTVISNNWEFQIQITNTSGTLSDLTMSGNTVSKVANPVISNLFNFLGGGSSVMKLSLTSGSFTGAAPSTADAISAVNQGTSHTVNVSGATFTNNNVGINVSSDPISTTFSFNIFNNNFQGTRAHPINSFHNANAPFTRTVNGKIQNNTIGTVGVANSGSEVGSGITISNEGAIGSLNLLITGNQIRQITSFPGITANVGLSGAATGGGTTNLTIMNNSFSNIGSRAMTIQDNQGVAPFPTICANISGNAFGAGITGQAGDSTWMRIRELSGTVNVTQAAPTVAINPSELDDANGGNNPTKFLISGAVAFSQPACTQPPFAAEDDEIGSIGFDGIKNGSEVFSTGTSSSTGIVASAHEAFTRIFYGLTEAISPTVIAEENTTTTNAPLSGETVSKALGSLPPGENIRVQFDVTVDANIPTNDFSVSNTANITADGGINFNSTTATTTVVHPPTISKAFGAANIALNGTTTLTFTITNANPATAFTNVAFSDTLPSGMVIASPNGLVNNCGGGTVTAAQGTNVFSVSALPRAANTTCTITVNVTVSTEGTKNNVTGAISSTEGGTGLTSAASVNVITAPSFTKAFGSPTIPFFGSTSLSFTITNNSPGFALSGIAFTDALPAGLVVATPNGSSGTCGAGTVTAVPGSGSVSLSGGTVAASGSCTFSVNVTGTTAGEKNNSVQLATAELGAGATANATVTVLAPTAADANIRGRVHGSEGRGASYARVELTDQNGNTQYAMTNPFGYFRFRNVPTGQSYVLTVNHKRSIYQTRTLTINEDVEDLNIFPVK